MIPAHKDAMVGEHKMTGAKNIVNKILGKKLEDDKESKNAAPPIKKATVPAPAPTKPTTTGWKPM